MNVSREMSLVGRDNGQRRSMNEWIEKKEMFWINDCPGKWCRSFSTSKYKR